MIFEIDFSGVTKPAMKILNKQGVSASYSTTERMIKSAGCLYDEMAVYFKECVDKNEHAETSKVFIE